MSVGVQFTDLVAALSTETESAVLSKKPILAGGGLAAIFGSPSDTDCSTDTSIGAAASNDGDEAVVNAADDTGKIEARTPTDAIHSDEATASVSTGDVTANTKIGAEQLAGASTPTTHTQREAEVKAENKAADDDDDDNEAVAIPVKSVAGLGALFAREGATEESSSSCHMEQASDAPASAPTVSAPAVASPTTDVSLSGSGSQPVPAAVDSASSSGAGAAVGVPASPSQAAPIATSRRVSSGLASRMAALGLAGLDASKIAPPGSTGSSSSLGGGGGGGGVAYTADSRRSSNTRSSMSSISVLPALVIDRPILPAGRRGSLDFTRRPPTVKPFTASTPVLSLEHSLEHSLGHSIADASVVEGFKNQASK